MVFTSATAGNLGGHLAAGRINWLTGPIKIMLCTSTFVPNKDTTLYKSDVTNEVATGNGYTQRGLALASKTAAYDAATDTTVLDAADASWTTAAGQELRYRTYVIYSDTGVDTTSPVMGWGVSVDNAVPPVGVDQVASNGGTATIAFDATGIVRLAT